MSVLVPKRTAEVPDINYGVCVWKLPDGTYIQNDSGDYLVIQGKVFSKELEDRMVKAARELGVEVGEPFWLPGFRKISESEWCDQMERLIDGHIPDATDVYRQALNSGITG